MIGQFSGLHFGLQYSIIMLLSLSIIQKMLVVFMHLQRELPTIAITQYGSTVYIGIAMGCPAL